jgi:hypothetical protein
VNSSLLALIVAILLTAVACGDDAPSDPAREVLTGAVVAVDARSLTNIDSFTLRTEDDQLEIYIDDSHNYSDTGFLPQHLREHVITAVRVRVEAERRGDRLVAVAMTDAE